MASESTPPIPPGVNRLKNGECTENRPKVWELAPRELRAAMTYGYNAPEFEATSEELSESLLRRLLKEPSRSIVKEYLDWLFSAPRSNYELERVWTCGRNEYFPKGESAIRETFLLLHDKLKTRPHSKRYLALAAKPHLKRWQHGKKGKKT
jgi:hypothetical protein